MNSMTLSYARDRHGQIMVHKRIAAKNSDGDRESMLVPVATPFGVPARLRYLDLGYSLWPSLGGAGFGGRPALIDVERSILAKQRAADARSLLLGAGLRGRGDGDIVAVACMMAANPQQEILVVKRPGWHLFDGQQHPLSRRAAKSSALRRASSSSSIGRLRLRPIAAAGGTLEGWKAAAKTAASVPGCPHWLIGIVAGFVGPLVSLTGHRHVRHKSFRDDLLRQDRSSTARGVGVVKPGDFQRRALPKREGDRQCRRGACTTRQPVVYTVPRRARPRGWENCGQDHLHRRWRLWESPNER